MDRLWKHFQPDQLDLVYGVRTLSRNRLMIGNQRIFFAPNYVRVGGCKYPLTVGLLELLFKKEPSLEKITADDLQHYKQILISSNVHRMNNRSDGKLRSSNILKWELIAKLLNKTFSSESENAVIKLTDTAKMEEMDANMSEKVQLDKDEEEPVPMEITPQRSHLTISNEFTQDLDKILSERQEKQTTTIEIIPQQDRLPVVNFDTHILKCHQEERRHSELLPNTIRAIVCGPSNCGKTTQTENRYLKDI